MYSLVPRAAHAASGPSRQAPLTTSGEGHSMSFIPITKLSVMTLDWEAGRMCHSWRGQRAQAAGNGDTMCTRTHRRVRADDDIRLVPCLGYFTATILLSFSNKLFFLIF